MMEAQETDETQEHGYELIVGTGVENDNHLAVATAVELIKNHLPDASVLSVAVYDHGGVGVDISTKQGGLDEQFYQTDGSADESDSIRNFDKLESVEYFPISQT